MNTPTATVTKLFIAADNKDWPQAKNYFHSTVRLDYSSMNGQNASDLTADDIIDSWKAILPGFTHTHHQIGNLTEEISGNSARVTCYGTASHYLEDANGNLWTVVGTYDFLLDKTQEEEWKVTAMTFHYKYQEGNTSLPEKAMNKIS